MDTLQGQPLVDVGDWQSRSQGQADIQVPIFTDGQALIIPADVTYLVLSEHYGTVKQRTSERFQLADDPGKVERKDILAGGIAILVDERAIARTNQRDVGICIKIGDLG